MEETEFVRTLPGLATCFWCDRVYTADHPLSVCADCLTRMSTMRLLEMSGPHALDSAVIDELLTRTSPGNYALGYLDGETFSVFYVGRSDCDLRRRLQQWVDLPTPYKSLAPFTKAPWGHRRRQQSPLETPRLGRVANVRTAYTRFAFSYASCAEEAYAKECRHYDVFGGGRSLDNNYEPRRTGPSSAR